MPILDVTIEQVIDVCRTVYEPSSYANAPAQLFLEHLANEATYLRASFPDKFSQESAEQLARVKWTLLSLYGRRADVVVVIYQDLLDAEELARRSVEIAAR